MPSATPAAEQLRAKQFKNSGKPEEMRRRRAEGSVELRKLKKDDQLMKRRNIDIQALTDDTHTSEGGGDDQLSPTLQDFNFGNCSEVLGMGPNKTGEYMTQLRDLRKILSRTHTPPLDRVIKAGLIPSLIAALSYPDTAIQIEAAWGLTNVVSGTAEQTEVVVSGGGVGALCPLVNSPDIQVAEQAVWALANIAGENAQYRDLVIDAGAVKAMLLLAQRPGLSDDFVRTLAWTFSNLCRHKRPQVETEKVQPLLPLIAAMIQHHDKQVNTDACWALSYFTDGPDERIGVALETGVLPHILSLLTQDDRKILAPALRALGNIVTGNDAQTQAVVRTGVLRTHIPALMAKASEYPALSRECCWMLSNVLAGTQEQIEAVIDAGLLPAIIDRLDKGDFRTQTEAAWGVTNLVSGGSPEQIKYLLSCEPLVPYSKLLTSKDPKIVSVVLDGLTSILDLSERCDELGMMCLTLEECGAVDFLEDLQRHENEDVYLKAVHMIEKYFGTDSDEGEENKENALPGQSEGSDVPKDGFQF